MLPPNLAFLMPLYSHSSEQTVTNNIVKLFTIQTVLLTEVKRKWVRTCTHWHRVIPTTGGSAEQAVGLGRKHGVTLLTGKHTGRPVRGISEWVFTFHGAVCRLGQLFTPNHCETTHKGVNNQRFDGKMYVVFRDEGGIPCIPARLTFTCGGFRPGAGCGASHRIRMAELVSFLAGVGGQGAVCMAAVRVRPADRCFGWGHHLLRIAPHD